MWDSQQWASHGFHVSSSQIIVEIFAIRSSIYHLQGIPNFCYVKCNNLSSILFYVNIHVWPFSGLLLCSPKLGLKEVYDWMVKSLAIAFKCSISQSFFYDLLSLLFSSIACSVVLFPVAVTFFVTWWFIQFVDGFFSPLYAQLGIDIFGMI